MILFPVISGTELIRLYKPKRTVISLRTGQKAFLGVGGPEQRGGGSSVFEPLVRGGSFNFQLPIEVGHPVFYGNWHTFGTTTKVTPFEQ